MGRKNRRTHQSFVVNDRKDWLAKKRLDRFNRMQDIHDSLMEKANGSNHDSAVDWLEEYPVPTTKKEQYEVKHNSTILSNVNQNENEKVKEVERVGLMGLSVPEGKTYDDYKWTKHALERLEERFNVPKNEATKWFRRLGPKMKMVTGNDPYTSRRYDAGEIRIVINESTYEIITLYPSADTNLHNAQEIVTQEYGLGDLNLDEKTKYAMEQSAIVQLHKKQKEYLTVLSREMGNLLKQLNPANPLEPNYLYKKHDYVEMTCVKMQEGFEELSALQESYDETLKGIRRMIDSFKNDYVPEERKKSNEREIRYMEKIE
jgi:hypothetical protein